MKICFKCGISKSLDNFYRHRYMSSGYLNKCKECSKSDVRSSRASRIDHYRAYDRVRGNRITKERRKRWEVENIGKKQAQTLIHNLLRAKKIYKRPCEECGEFKYIHAHHDDYLKPFEVRWLCVAHHSQWHKQNGEGKNGKINLKDYGLISINNYTPSVNSSTEVSKTSGLGAEPREYANF